MNYTLGKISSFVSLFMTQSWCMDHLYDGLWGFLVIQKLESLN